jgi:ParB family chromosome partitioning protein
MALGRGLSELLGEVETAYDNSTSKDSSKNIIELDIDIIKANPNQPRKIFDETKLQELADSIKAHGLLQPVTVYKNDKEEYILISGERRLRAHKLIGIETIKSYIMDIEEYKLRELALIENIQRDDLNVIELAYSYAQLINEHNITHDELASRVFKSRSSITNTLRLLSLSAYAQQMLANDKISAGHAKVLTGLSDDEQKIVIDSIIGQKLSVRETEQLVKELKGNNKSESKSKKQTMKFDTKILSPVFDLLKENDLKADFSGNYLKIKVNSQQDLEKLAAYFLQHN